MKIIIAVAIFTIIYVFGMDLGKRYLDNLDYNYPIEEVMIEEERISVEISGAILNPGTYSLDANSSLNDLISKAGGLENNADESAFKKTLKLKDGNNYYIARASIDENNVNLKVSLNTADEELLDTLPGIGTVYARRIVEYRKTNGNFQCIEEIMNVSGIGKGTFSNLKDDICL